MDFIRVKKQDFVITALLVVLILIGNAVIYASTFNTIQNDLIIKQTVLVIGSLVIYFLLTTLDLDWLKIFSIQIIIYAAILLTLVYVNFFGNTIAGTNRWIDFGFFAFQPSEYAKVVVVLLTAFIFGTDFKQKKPSVDFEKLHKKSSLINDLVESIKNNHELKLTIINACFIMPILFFTFIQPALGNTIIIFALWSLTLLFSYKNTLSVLKYLLLFVSIFFLGFSFISFDKNISVLFFDFNFLNPSIYLIIFAILSLIFFTKIKLVKVLIILLVSIFSVASVFVGWNYLLGGYQKARVVNFVSGPESDPLGSGYQIIQSKIAIGSGQLWGRGYLEGTQSSLHILTQAETDFAFAALSEQFGFVGATMVLMIYMLLILRILKVSGETTDRFGKIICFGVASLLLIHIFINIGMNLGKLPVTGIPLPLISYGGSSVLMTLILLGLVQAVYTSRKPVDMADSLVITSLKVDEIPE